MLTGNDLHKVVFVSSLNGLLGNVLLRRILNMYKMLIVLESQVDENTQKVFLGKGLILSESRSHHASSPINFFSRIVALVRAKWVSKLTPLSQTNDAENSLIGPAIDSLVQDPESKLAEMLKLLGAEKAYLISVRNFMRSEAIGMMIIVKDIQEASKNLDDSKAEVRTLFC